MFYKLPSQFTPSASFCNCSHHSTLFSVDPKIDWGHKKSYAGTLYNGLCVFSLSNLLQINTRQPYSGIETCNVDDLPLRRYLCWASLSPEDIVVILSCVYEEFLLVFSQAIDISAVHSGAYMYPFIFKLQVPKTAIKPVIQDPLIRALKER